MFNLVEKIHHLCYLPFEHKGIPGLRPLSVFLCTVPKQISLFQLIELSVVFITHWYFCRKSQNCPPLCMFFFLEDLRLGLQFPHVFISLFLFSPSLFPNFKEHCSHGWIKSWVPSHCPNIYKSSHGPLHLSVTQIFHLLSYINNSNFSDPMESMRWDSILYETYL